MTAPETTVEHAIHALRAHSQHTPHDPARTIAALRAAASALLQSPPPNLIHELHQTTGLTPPMISWGLTTTLRSLLDAPLPTFPSQPPQLIAVVLAGNVFTAALRAICLPLLTGAHVIAKTASAEATFARAWHAALHAADSEVAARLALVHFPRTATAATRALCEHADALSIYGDDQTVESLGQHAPPNCRIIPHGHGISAAYVTRTQLANKHLASKTADRLALDIAAYDQYGCLSPQFVAVEPGAAITPQAFAELLAHEALPRMQRQLPAGTPDITQTAARMQWCAAAAVRGELYAHDTHAVSFEDTLPARPSPGGRLISVHSCNDITAFLEPYTQHLKLVGVDAPGSADLAVSTCPIGQMQTPAFDAWADGRPPFAGLLKHQ